MSIELLTKFVSLKGDCTGSSESIHVKMPHSWGYQVATQMVLLSFLILSEPPLLLADDLMSSVDT